MKYVFLIKTVSSTGVHCSVTNFQLISAARVQHKIHQTENKTKTLICICKKIKTLKHYRFWIRKHRI